MRNSTIINKKKQLKCGHFDYNFSKGRCRQCATQQDSLKRISEYEEQEDTQSMANLRDDLDALVSRYVRLKYMDEKTKLIKCFTCQKELPMAEMTNGHYVSRSNMVLRFDTEWNLRPQCPICNSRHETDEEPFTLALELEKAGITSYLKEKGREVYKFTIDELKSLIAEYRFKNKILEKKIKR